MWVKIDISYVYSGIRKIKLINWEEGATLKCCNVYDDHVHWLPLGIVSWLCQLSKLDIFYWRREEARRQYGIGFNFVPWGDVIEKGATNIIIVKKNSVICLKKQKTFMNK